MYKRGYYANYREQSVKKKYRFYQLKSILVMLNKGNQFTNIEKKWNIYRDF